MCCVLPVCFVVGVSGILDQGSGVLEVFEEPAASQTYDTTLETVHSIGRVVDGLYHKAKKLS